MKKTLFLTEAGDGIGFGHLSRVSALADFFRSNGAAVELLVHWKRSAVHLSHDGRVFDWITEEVESKPPDLWDAVFIDSYIAGPEIYEYYGQSCRQLIVLDDYNRMNYPADILVNPGLNFSPQLYAGQKARCFGGSKYLIFRSAFREGYKATVKSVKDSVLITVGGSDYRGLLYKLAGLKRDFPNITMLCPETAQRAKLLAQFPDLQVLGPLNEHEILREYQLAEIVVSGCGQSINELALLSKKVVGLLIGDDQKNNAEFYLQSGFLNTIISWDDLDLLQKVRAEISRLRSEGPSKGFSHRLELDPDANMRNYFKLLSK
jgi:UDP-2,4-diacetamido-2,4,6-trideoxy-beta-L-altropyranose hydrolase